MKYLVKTHCLEWHNIEYIVEADSEEEAEDLVMSGDTVLYSDNLDCTDEINIESVEKYEN